MLDYRGNYFSSAVPLISGLAVGSAYELNADYSGAPVEATYAVGAYTTDTITGLEILLGWTNPLATTAFSFNEFGSLAALTNGISINVSRSGRVETVNYPVITTNSQFYDPQITQTTLGMFITGKIILSVPVILSGATSDYIHATLNDNFSGLDTFIINVIGSSGYSF